MSTVLSYTYATQADFFLFLLLILRWLIFVPQVKNVELQRHVVEGELHDPIPAVDYSIRCGQKWPPKYDGHSVSTLCH